MTIEKTQVEKLNEQIAILHKRLLEKETDLSMAELYLKFALTQIPECKIEVSDQVFEISKDIEIRKYRNFEKKVLVIEVYEPSKTNGDHYHE